VDQASKPAMPTKRSYYDANYGNFQIEIYEQVRRDAFGEDIGQNSWLTEVGVGSRDYVAEGA